MSLEEIIESYDSTISLISNNERKEITKIDICLNYVYDVSCLLNKHNNNVDHDKKLILSDKDKDLHILFEKQKILIQCEFKQKKKEYHYELSSTFFNDKHKENIVSNQDCSDNAVKESNN
ncbi:962_t:CDS:2, partial [Cetraspora pellucida]